MKYKSFRRKVFLIVTGRILASCSGGPPVGSVTASRGLTQ